MESKEKLLTTATVNTIKMLSKVEREILLNIKQGKTSAEIAAVRNCSTRTVEKHRSNIIQKLGIKSSQNALLLWIVKHPNLFKT
ncbi:helix-turn-helix transcriptional regulator [Aureisphaera sp. CAU 1614]|uniref:Helix-turn-helix transcriptional regulator n=1 Tax=Halomarinibacterium sedimenti TaxID=2857106 RepID=A0A9X1FND6_9FLAO|nr:helix-turn-helix transcriptional regulator [Halomarinibacterium sedimenti]MBW2937642.1 helix-turn-helix transcriptional regulator [Halomarinibacterium sedimenti]